MAHHLKLNSLEMYAQIAQLVEQGTENPRVLGSIPSLGTIFFLKKNVIQSAHVFFEKECDTISSCVKNR